MPISLIVPMAQTLRQSSAQYPFEIPTGFITFDLAGAFQITNVPVSDSLRTFYRLQVP